MIVVFAEADGVNLIPRTAEASRRQLAEARTLRYRLERRWAALLHRPVSPSYESILSHCELFGVAPGHIITSDEFIAWDRASDGTITTFSGGGRVRNGVVEHFRP